MLQNICKSWEQPVVILIDTFGEIPTSGDIRTLAGVFQNSGHGSIHRPAHIENFHKPIQMLQHMNIPNWEAERVDAQQLCQLRVGTVYRHVLTAAESALIFTFGRFYYQKMNRIVFCQFVQDMIHGI